VIVGDNIRLSELQNKKIINITDGKNIGNIIDINLYENGTIESLILETTKSFFFLNKETDRKIMWKDITKIGEDVILVKSNYNEDN
jgi:YlmC/YmxH family sporulation protein